MFHSVFVTAHTLDHPHICLKHDLSLPIQYVCRTSLSLDHSHSEPFSLTILRHDLDSRWRTLLLPRSVLPITIVSPLHRVCETIASCDGSIYQTAAWMVRTTVSSNLQRRRDVTHAADVSGREVDGRRWAFWKFRFEVLREDLRLDDEMADIALQASRLL
jgi:hypothetical protein